MILFIASKCILNQHCKKMKVLQPLRNRLTYRNNSRVAALPKKTIHLHTIHVKVTVNLTSSGVGRHGQVRQDAAVNCAQAAGIQVSKGKAAANVGGLGRGQGGGKLGTGP